RREVARRLRAHEMGVVDDREDAEPQVWVLRGGGRLRGRGARDERAGGEQDREKRAAGVHETPFRGDGWRHATRPAGGPGGRVWAATGRAVLPFPRLGPAPRFSRVRA